MLDSICRQMLKRRREDAGNVMGLVSSAKLLTGSSAPPHTESNVRCSYTHHPAALHRSVLDIITPSHCTYSTERLLAAVFFAAVAAAR